MKKTAIHLHLGTKINKTQRNSISEILKDVGVGIFTGITVGVILGREFNILAPAIAILFSLLLWYINLVIAKKMTIPTTISGEVVMIMMAVPLIIMGLLAIKSQKDEEEALEKSKASQKK